jgi:hypothetical protein
MGSSHLRDLRRNVELYLALWAVVVLEPSGTDSTEKGVKIDKMS